MKLTNGAHIYYFGCRGPKQAGHYWQGIERGEDGRSAQKPAFIPKCVARSIDGGFYDESLPEGEAVLTYVNDCTVMGFCDQSGDSRGGSHSAFVITMDHYPFERFLKVAQNVFPEVFARFDFEVRLHCGEGSDAAK